MGWDGVGYLLGGVWSILGEHPVPKAMFLFPALLWQQFVRHPKNNMYCLRIHTFAYSIFIMIDIFWSLKMYLDAEQYWVAAE